MLLILDRGGKDCWASYVTNVSCETGFSFASSKLLTTNQLSRGPLHKDIHIYLLRNELELSDTQTYDIYKSVKTI